MEQRKQDRDDELQAAYYRTLSSKDVKVKRTLIGRQPDYLSLATAVNVLSVGHLDTPEERLNTERLLRRGTAIHTALGRYEVISPHVFPDWTHESESTP